MRGRVTTALCLPMVRLVLANRTQWWVMAPTKVSNFSVCNINGMIFYDPKGHSTAT